MDERHKHRRLFWASVVALIAGMLLSAMSFWYLLAMGRGGSKDQGTETIAAVAFSLGLLVSVVSLSGLILLAYHPVAGSRNDRR